MNFEYSSDGKLLKRSDGLEFIYDLQGVAGVVDNSGSTAKTYFYRKDAQGNIVALLDENGAVVVKYVYNAWGEHKVLNPDGTENTSASFIGNINPFRYRGYYYDKALKLYYLVTRYYDPVVGRFISQDALDYADPDTINGLNLYAYCNNNPVMNVDPTGHAWYDVLAWIGVGLFATALTVATLGMFGIALGGIAGGVVMGAAIGTLVLGTAGAGIGAVGGMIYDAAIGNNFGTSIWTLTKAGFGIGSIAGAVIGGAIGGAAGASLSGVNNLMLWSGLGKNGATIAAQEAGKLGLKTIGQTFGGKVISMFPNFIAQKMWIWASKLAVSTISMKSIIVFTGLTIFNGSVYLMYEQPILIERGIEIIRRIFGG